MSMEENNNITLRFAEYFDIPIVAKLHKSRINKGFLSSLGEKFLSILYKTLIESSKGILIVAVKENIVVGFVSGITDLKGFHADFLKQHFLSAFVYLFKKIFSLTVLKKLFEAFFYPQKSKKYALPDAELLSISIQVDFEGQGIAKKLFMFLAEEFKKKQVMIFKIIVGGKLEQAIKFYEGVGCKRKIEIEVHQGEVSYVYLYEIQ